MRTKLPIRATTRTGKISKRQPARRPFGPTKIDFKPDGGWGRSGGRFTDNRGDNRGAASLTFRVFVSVIFSLLFSYQVPDNQNDVDHGYRQYDGQQIPALDVVDQIAVAPNSIGDEEAG